MITIFRLEHQSKPYIGIHKSIPAHERKKILLLKNIRFSKTYDCYCMPYARRYYNALVATGIQIQISQTGNAGSHTEKCDNNGIEHESSSSVTPEVKDADTKEESDSESEPGPGIQWSGNNFYVRIAYSPKESIFIKNLNGSYWSKEHKNWVIKATLENLEALQDRYHKFSLGQFQKIKELLLKKKNPQALEIFQSPEYPKQLLIRLIGYGIDFEYIKQIKSRQYDPEHKRWIIDFDQNILDRLIAHYASRRVRIINRVNSGIPSDYKKSSLSTGERKRRLIHKYGNALKPLIQKYVDRMILEKYGWRTIISYTGKFAKFKTYYMGCDLDELTAGDVNAFLVKLVNEDVSESLHNMYLSAIKFYYEQVAYRADFKIERLSRPRKGRYLPTILSVNEVDRMFRTLSNMKHLAICYTIYSGGLRLSEILNLRVQDIIWDRNQVLVKSGKGNKDRYTLLGLSLKAILRLYFDEYKPIYWLFEGMDKKTPYSESSVQNIVRRSARSAGIARRVTPHTLRHCFATHLLDKGTDVRYIQELLGHKDIKTTLVYTHVTTRSMEKIKSPLDELMEQRLLQKAQ
ncbi:tyrosine-type recombinase/integrase [Portibacter marinus]|uniref:tyrosine-type recombinase/integrase n=1 Tax=Portibacter marinus TaxID=2898660 RepID=UPI001F429874|nr:tyrosine-type recombinase/integrase [Portibacter marinus]